NYIAKKHIYGQGTLHMLYVVFFFQAEDGIRDRNVTGVQTCALPISLIMLSPSRIVTTRRGSGSRRRNAVAAATSGGETTAPSARSEERRVGKECRSRGERDH